MRLHTEFSRKSIDGVIAVVSAAFVLSTAAQSPDWFPLLETKSGAKYENCVVKMVDPDGLVIMHARGTRKVKFSDLSPELQKKYNYDPKKAEEFAKVDAVRKRKVLLAAEARAAIFRGQVTGQFNMDFPQELEPPLSDFFKSTHIGTGSGTVVEFDVKTITRRRKNAVGGEGLPNMETIRTKDVKNLGRFLVVGRKEDFTRGSETNRSIFPIVKSVELLKSSRPIYAFSPEVAMAASVTLADLERQRAVPVTEKKALGQSAASVWSQYDPFMRRKMAVNRDRLEELKNARAEDSKAILAVDLAIERSAGTAAETIQIPKVLTVALISDGECDTVLYRTPSNLDALPLSEAEVLSLFENSTGRKFEEIDLGGKLEIVTSYGGETDDDWLRNIGASKAYWSDDAKYLVLGIASRPGEDGFRAAWGTSRLAGRLAEIKADHPPEWWWSQISGALSEHPPEIYKSDFSGKTEIETY